MNTRAASLKNPSGALERVYLDHHGWLRHWLQSRLGCPDAAADLAQDTFVRVVARREELQRAPLRQPRAFLRVIAGGLLVDHLRRRDLERAFLDALSAQPDPTALSAEEGEILLETLDRIDQLLDRLSAPVRRAFLLSQLDGLGYAAIARRMGVSERTVKRYMQQAYRQCLAALV